MPRLLYKYKNSGVFLGLFKKD